MASKTSILNVKINSTMIKSKVNNISSRKKTKLKREGKYRKGATGKGQQERKKKRGGGGCSWERGNKEGSQTKIEAETDGARPKNLSMLIIVNKEKNLV